MSLRLRKKRKESIWDEEIDKNFPECGQIIARLLVHHQKRSRWLAKYSTVWFRLFGGIEIVLGVTLPLLFIYPQTQDNTPLLASVSVIVAVSSALSAFFAWSPNRGVYTGQEVAVSSILSEWELSMMELLLVASEPDVKKRALDVTREAVRELFEALTQEHQSIFTAAKTPDEIIAEVKRNKLRSSQMGP
ncbi:hypothetical protein [Nonomuraea sp. NPDC049646]|uniref:hypothetical protein n=1 Tax=unclassified Nonomuraea TaxID=2593643 RepID=UPI0037AA4110